MRYFQALQQRLHARSMRRAEASVAHVGMDPSASADLAMDWLELHHPREWPVCVIAALQILICVLLAGAFTAMEVLPTDAQARSKCTAPSSTALLQDPQQAGLKCCLNPAWSATRSAVSCPAPTKGA